MLPANLRLAIIESLPLLRGWGGKGERPFRMAELVIKENPTTVVEIGVFGGQSLVPQAMALKLLNNGGRIYGIDPYSLEVIAEQLADYDDATMWLKQDMDLVRNDLLTLIKEFGLEDVVYMVRAESSNCRYNSIDILHIDGAHTEEGALLDVKLHATRVRPKGYIWMDDTHFPSLEPALKELETFADLVDDFGGYRLYQHR
jgi:predicted O-methyltransferase YrrM